jgi:nucleoid-associated protein YgaU
MPAVLAVAAGLLMAGAPAPRVAIETLRTAPTAADPAADPAAPLLAAAALLAWALVAWLLALTLSTAAGRLPGLAGAVCGQVAQRLAPTAVRRLVEVALGVSVVVGATAVPASAVAAPPPPAPRVAALDWPAATPLPHPLDWPAAAGPAARGTSAQRVDVRSLAAPAEPAPAAAARRTAPAVVTVRPGDSLWAIAADHLPAGADDARIAQAWPSWWAANRAAVGADPDLIHPGLQLHPPAQS